MLKSLLNEKLKSDNKKVIFDYDKYFTAVESICEDIKNNYNVVEEKIGILGMARGGLPLLVSVSHGIGVRNVSVIQTQMSNSDNCHDYGEVRFINQCIDENISKFILLEDIIFKGNTTNAVINILKKMNKEVLCVYSLVIDEDFKKIQIENNDIDIKYAYEIDRDDWVYFLWEQNINKIKE